MQLNKADLEMASAFATTFSTPSGQRTLKELDRMYYNTNLHVPGDSEATHVRVGSHMVVAAIYKLIELAHDPRAVDQSTIVLGDNDHG
jgi:hypothetical protein